MPLDRDRTGRFNRLEDPRRLRNNEFLADPTRHELTHQARAIDRPPCCVALCDLTCAGVRTCAAPSCDLRPGPRTNFGARNAADRDGTGRRSGLFLSDRPLPNSRTRDANVAGMSTTCSPAARSCWANKYPSPPAHSIAHVRAPASSASAHATNSDTWRGLRARAVHRAPVHGLRPRPPCGSPCVDRHRS